MGSYGLLRALWVLRILYGPIDLKVPASQEIRANSMELIRGRDPKSFRIYSLVVFGHVRYYMIIIHRASYMILFVAYSSNFLLWVFSNKYFSVLVGSGSILISLYFTIYLDVNRSL